MALLSKVIVEGFWGDHTVSTTVNDDITFFIGPNGTGKTTLINLIAAGLTGDLAALYEISFSSLRLELSASHGTAKPIIEYEKPSEQDLSFPLRVFVRPKKSSKREEIIVPEEHHRYVRRVNQYHDKRAHWRLNEQPQSYLAERISELISVSWISVNRAPPIDTREDGARRHAIDRRLYRLQNRLVRRLASISNKRDEEIRSFQQDTLLTLLAAPDRNIIAAKDSDKHIESQIQELRHALTALNVSSGVANKKLKQFENNAKSAYKKFTSGAPLALEELDYASSVHRIDTIVRRWDKYRLNLNLLYEEIDTFLYVLNPLLNRKAAHLGNNNELCFRSRSGKTLTLYELSSGEKQLLILLLEALLQNNEAHTFIADEPEISLHVEWQEKLVDSIQAINPSAQLIFATHSPDIVAGRNQKIVRMDEILP